MSSRINKVANHLDSHQHISYNTSFLILPNSPRRPKSYEIYFNYV